MNSFESSQYLRHAKTWVSEEKNLGLQKSMRDLYTQRRIEMKNITANVIFATLFDSMKSFLNKQMIFKINTVG